MKNKLLLFTIVLIMIISLTSCGNDSEIVGSWRGVLDENYGLETTFMFADNGVGTMTSNGSTTEFRYEAKDGILEFYSEGWSKEEINTQYTYEIKDNILTLGIDSLSMSLTRIA